jgi:hypothetical protein
MTTFDEREKGFESKFARDQEHEFLAKARRNRMLGEWAARRMGLRNVEDYVKAIVRTDLHRHGDEHVLRKVTQDLAGSGLSVSEGMVRAKMDEFLAIARGEISTGP